MRINKNTRHYKVTQNHSRQTYTIRVQNYNGKTIFKYRTHSFNAEDFYSMEYNTQIDWANFLKTDEYYIIKTYYNNL